MSLRAESRFSLVLAVVCERADMLVIALERTLFRGGWPQPRESCEDSGNRTLWSGPPVGCRGLVRGRGRQSNGLLRVPAAPVRSAARIRGRRGRLPSCRARPTSAVSSAAH